MGETINLIGKYISAQAYPIRKIGLFTHGDLGEAGWQTETSRELP